jgi:trk system potassium uptake protein TrkA
MYIVIAGGGVIGSHIASLLSEEGQEVTVVDQSAKVLQAISRQLDVKTITGNAANPRVLKRAEAERADLVLAVTDSDEANMITCFMAKELGAGTTAARTRTPEYASYFISPAKSPMAVRKVVRPRKLGIDVFINPEAEAAEEVMSILSGFYSTPVENFADDLVQIREFRVEEETLADKTLGTINFPQPCVIAAIVREGGIVTPDADEVLILGDSVYLVASREFMDELGTMFSEPKRPAKSVVIFGGGRIGFLTADGLQRGGIKTKVIESDTTLCQEIAARLDRVEVVQGDGTDRNFLIEQGVPSADAFVATTLSDELNILCGLLAKNLGVPRSLVIINKPGYVPLAEAIGIDVAALPPLLAADKITRFVLHGGAISTALLEGKQLEAIEFVTGPTAYMVNRKISEAGLPKEAVAGAIVRDGTVIIPPDEHVVEPGDHVIIVSPLSVVPAVEKLFK